MYELNCVETDRTGPSLQKIKAIPELRNNTGYGSFNTINKNFFFVLLTNIQKKIFKILTIYLFESSSPQHFSVRES